MRKRSSSAFTLIEVVTTMAIIVILTSIVVGIAGYVQNKASRSRAETERSMLLGAVENYKSENGGYPVDASTDLSTDKLSPKQHFIPTASEYQKASVFLYKELTGDKAPATGSGDPDGVPDSDASGNLLYPAYLKQFDPRILMVVRDTNTRKITKVTGFQDPWGYFYAYSTAALSEEKKFQDKLRTGTAGATRSTGAANPGFNISGPDFWSTGGSKPSTQPATDKLKDQETAKWIKNW
jgi:prepilin-type N-terminal cleavage/methylation domain-containing protein